MKTTAKFFKCMVCMLICLSVIAVVVPQGMAQESDATVVTYPGPTGIDASEKYAVKVNGITSFMYQTSRSDRYAGEAGTASFTNFSFSGGSVTIEVTKLDAASINSVTIRPLDNNVKAEIVGNKAIFTIDEPMHISVEFDGKTTDKCFIFADPPETDVPDKDADNVWYFGPGVHDIGETDFPEGKNIMYISGGAYVKGKITAECQGRGEVKILGRGIFSGENNAHSDLNHMIGIYQADRFIMDGPILLDTNSFHIQVTGSRSTPEKRNILNNVKEIAWVPNSDGFHMNGHIEVSNMFIFNYDDALDISQYTQSAIVRDCVVWNNNYGSALLLGWVSKVDTGNAVVDNIDVIHFDEYRTDAANNAVIMANHGEMGHIDNVFINDVHVENFGGGVQKFISLRLNKSAWSGATSPYGNISNIYLSNIRIDPPSMDNVLFGKDKDHMIKNVVFENLKIAGSPVANMDEAGLTVNEFVSGVRFIQTSVKNGSMEFGTSNWETNGTDGAAKVSVADFANKLAGNGIYVGEHSASKEYTAETYQTISGLKSGRYTLMAKVKASGSDGHSFMYAQVGNMRMKYPVSVTEEYQIIRIPNVLVNGGSCKVGFITEGGQEDTLYFDQVSLVKQDKQLANEAKVVLEALSVAIPEPPTTEPPITQPPATEPPATQPPVTVPPTTQPPATEPPTTEPPVTQPPATEPSTTEPPATQPQNTEPKPTTPSNGQGEKNNNRTFLIVFLIVDAVLLVGLAAIVIMIIKKKKR